MDSVPFVDLRAQYRSIKSEIDEALQRVLDSGQFVLGEEVAAFEREFAAYCEGRHAVAVNSGTSALHLSLVAAGIGPGDEVITVPFTFVATVAAIGYTGARAVLVDVDPVFFTMRPDQIEDAITPRTRAIVPVHLYGQCAEMEPILDLARRHGLLIIEDAAQAHGSRLRGRPAGSMGDVACFSFYPGKNLGAYGEGGLVLARDPAVAERIRMLRDWGQGRHGHHELKGYNYRMEALQGAILRVKLRHLEAWTEARRERAAEYTRLLSDSGVEPPSERSDGRHVFQVYAVRSAHRNGLREHLAGRGICTGIHYPTPVHLQPAYLDLGYRSGGFPCAERLSTEVLSLPLFPELSSQQLQRVVSAVRDFRGTGRAH